MDNTYLIKWIGPFKSIDTIKDFENESSNTFNLYLMSGLKKYAKKPSYYVGETYRQKISQRLNNHDHHINDFFQRKEIWIGQFLNVKAKQRDIRLVEKMLTAYLVYDPEIGRNSMLNKTNLLPPNSDVYIINRWYDIYQNEWQRNNKYSPARVTADVIAYRCDELGNCIMCESKKLKKSW